MRFLHTSDWHVGKVLKGLDRSAEHDAVLSEIVAVAEQRQVDAVLVAGDLYESAVPAAEAQRLVVRTLLELRATGAEVVAMAGNHDHAAAFDAYRPLMAAAGIHLVGSARTACDGGIVAFEARSTGEPVRVAVLPFVSHQHVVRAAQIVSRTPADHAATYSALVRGLLGGLAEGFTDDSVSLLMAHLAVTGAKLGGGERPAQSVLEYHVPPDIFPASADYVAMGHMHRRQWLAGPAPLHYSGSPIVVDFGEQDSVPVVLVIDVQAGKPPDVEDVPLRSARRLRTIRGTLDELAAAARTAGPAGPAAIPRAAGPDLLRLFVREKARAGLHEQVASLFPNALEVRIDPGFAAAAPGSRPGHTAGARRSPAELFTEYCSTLDVEDERLTALFNRLHDEVTAPAPAGAGAGAGAGAPPPRAAESEPGDPVAAGAGVGGRSPAGRG